jgi:hypothetical protein
LIVAVREHPNGLSSWQQACIQRLSLSPNVTVRSRTAEADGDAEARADVILDFSGGLRPIEMQAWPRFGVWSYAFGDSATGAADAPFLGDALRGECSGRVVLYAQMSDGSARDLKSGVYGIRAASYEASRDALLSDCAAWPSIVSAELERGYPLTSYATRASEPAQAPVQPAAPSLAPLRLRAARLGQRFTDLLRYEHWNIGILSRPIQSLVDEPTISGATWLTPQPRGRYVADPFGYSHGGKDVLICEAYDYRDKRGTIVSGEIDRTSAHVDFSTVLSEDHHLSYPYIVPDLALRMVPEASESNAVTSYAIGDDDERWHAVDVLLDGVAAVDPSIIFYQGMWWLFCTSAEDPLLKLSIYHSARFEGPWQAHARNPVKTDIRSARPGGTPFSFRGSLFRPAQDCASSYGSRITLNRVTLLTPEDFAEETAAVIEPDPHSAFRDGLHTVSAFGENTLIDGKYHAFVWSEFASKAARLAGFGRTGR